jgi:hypothetical protein
MLTIDLGAETEKRLDELCRKTGSTPSEIIRMSLAEWLEEFDSSRPDAYELGEDFFGTFELPEWLGRLESEVPDAYELGKDLFGQGGPYEKHRAG